MKNAIIRNATGEKYDALASPASLSELRKHRNYFEFNFEKLGKEYIIYKLYTEIQPLVIQGLVACKPTPGALECVNMETHKLNKQGTNLYTGTGKCIIALCCKISVDNGMEGNIFFDAKNRLIPFYQRFGAKYLFGLRMVIEMPESQKLIDRYFKKL